VNIHLYASVALPPGARSLLPTELESGCSTEENNLVSLLRKENRSLSGEDNLFMNIRAFPFVELFADAGFEATGNLA
jgi:hypothetical protein